MLTKDPLYADFKTHLRGIINREIETGNYSHLVRCGNKLSYDPQIDSNNPTKKMRVNVLATPPGRIKNGGRFSQENRDSDDVKCLYHHVGGLETSVVLTGEFDGKDINTFWLTPEKKETQIGISFRFGKYLLEPEYVKRFCFHNVRKNCVPLSLQLHGRNYDLFIKSILTLVDGAMDEKKRYIQRHMQVHTDD